MSKRARVCAHCGEGKGVEVCPACEGAVCRTDCAGPSPLEVCGYGACAAVVSCCRSHGLAEGARPCRDCDYVACARHLDDLFHCRACGGDFCEDCGHACQYT